MLVGYGADVVVLDPPEVRDAVVARLREVAVTYQEPAALPQQGRPASDVAGTPAGVG